jgi:methylated-DNA-[protein]-cysteine S-methyltransferase
MVLVAIVPAPWGPIHLAATDRGIVALETLTIREAFVAGLARRGIRDVSDAGAAGSDVEQLAGVHLDRARATVADALDGDAGAIARLTELAIDVADRAAFDREVFDAVRSVPPGSVTSYGRLAQRVGRPGAARAVGGAVGRCPVGMLIPCHRIIAADGSLGGYGVGWGGREAHLEVKRRLLELEGVRIPADRLA